MSQILLDEIEKKNHLYDYSDLVDYVFEKIEKGELRPVKASGLNGKKPALYLKYKIIEPGKDYEALKEEMKFSLNARISLDYYLKHPEVYEKERIWVLRLSEYFNEKNAKGNPSISLNELSYEIFKREKFLSKGEGKTVLSHCNLHLSDFNYYETSEPLAYFSMDRSTPQNILILENKDTFYSMRSVMIESLSRDNHSKSRNILSTNFSTLIYGAGKGIYRSFSDFDICLEPYMKDKNNTIYYFGDLDYEGIGIYEKLKKDFSLGYDIRLFKDAYIKMLDKALIHGSSQMLDELPDTKLAQNRNISDVFLNEFDDEHRGTILNILEAEKYIPQEILNIKDY